MSRKHQSITNKNPKVYFKQYLGNINEPDNFTYDDDMPPELLAELLENSFNMRRRVRQIAKRIRKGYSY